MDRRRQFRFSANQAVSIVVLGDNEARYPATVKDFAGRGLGVATAVRLLAGAAVAVEGGDCLLLGEVVYSREDGNAFVTGLKLELGLTGLAELQRLFGEPDREPAFSG